MKTRTLVFWIGSVASLAVIAIAIRFSLIESTGFSRDVSTPETIRERMNDATFAIKDSVHSRTETTQSPELDQLHTEIRHEFDSLVAGNEEIDAFIRRHLARAESGDAQSAMYVAEAMRYCIMDLNMLELTIQQHQIDAASPDKVKEAIMGYLVGMTSFSRAEALRHIDRGFSCRSLGWDVNYLTEISEYWEDFAYNEGQSLAVARAASLNPAGPVSNSDLEVSKSVMREVLSNSREFRVLTYASTVAAVSLEAEFEFERLSWRLLACEYESCDTLNYYYRGLCDMMGSDGAHICTDGITDIEFLFRRYPEQFDAARARALEIKRAIDSEQWELIGLN